MQTASEFNTVAHVIQQAVAPVFLLTGVGAILGVLTSRLGRVIDRLRQLAGFALDSPRMPEHQEEMHVLIRRRLWIHWAITACTLCALLVCLVIAVLFLGWELSFDPSDAVGMMFIAAMASLVAGLLCFLREIALSTSMNFDVR